jgi:hypothetical protein
MPPLWQYFLPLRKPKPDESIPAPKGRESWPLSGYSCKSVVFRVPQWGAMTSVMAPPTTPSALPRFGPEGRLTGGRRLCPRCGSTSRVCKAGESIAAPKGHGPPDSATFSLQTRAFVGAAKGAMIRFMDPS